MSTGTLTGFWRRSGQRWNRRAFTMRRGDGGGDMEPHEIAAYAEGNLDAAARERAEVHLADCASCRADALAALRARDRAPLGTRWVPPALAAAAIVALLVSRTGHGAIPFARERVA